MPIARPERARCIVAKQVECCAIELFACVQANPIAHSPTDSTPVAPWSESPCELHVRAAPYERGSRRSAGIHEFLVEVPHEVLADEAHGGTFAHEPSELCVEPRMGRLAR